MGCCFQVFLNHIALYWPPFGPVPPTVPFFWEQFKSNFGRKRMHSHSANLQSRCPDAHWGNGLDPHQWVFQRSLHLRLCFPRECAQFSDLKVLKAAAAGDTRSSSKTVLASISGRVCLCSFQLSIFLGWWVFKDPLSSAHLVMIFGFKSSWKVKGSMLQWSNELDLQRSSLLKRLATALHEYFFPGPHCPPFHYNSPQSLRRWRAEEEGRRRACPCGTSAAHFVLEQLPRLKW